MEENIREAMTAAHDNMQEKMVFVSYHSKNSIKTT